MLGLRECESRAVTELYGEYVGFGGAMMGAGEAMAEKRE